MQPRKTIAKLQVIIHSHRRCAAFSLQIQSAEKGQRICLDIFATETGVQGRARSAGWRPVGAGRQHSQPRRLRHVNAGAYNHSAGRNANAKPFQHLGLPGALAPGRTVV